MYDKQNEAREFVAESKDEAIAEATRFFDTEASELRVSELDPLAVHGLSGRIVLVAAPSSAPRVTAGGGDADRGRGERGGRRERGGRDRERGGRDRERGGRDRERGGRDRERGGRDRERGGRGRGDDAQRPEPRVAAADSKGTAVGELGEIGQFLLGVVERMGLGPFEIRESVDGDFVVLRLDGDAAAALGAGDRGSPAGVPPAARRDARPAVLLVQVGTAR